MSCFSDDGCPDSASQKCCCPKCETLRLDCHACCKCLVKRLELSFVADDVNQASPYGVYSHVGNGTYSGDVFNASVYIDQETCSWRIISEDLSVDATIPISETGCTDPVFANITAEYDGDAGVLVIRPVDRIRVPYEVLSHGRCKERVCDNCVCLYKHLCLAIEYWPDGLVDGDENSRIQWGVVSWDDTACAYIGVFQEIVESSINEGAGVTAFPEMNVRIDVNRISEENHNCDLFLTVPEMGIDYVKQDKGSFLCDVPYTAMWGYVIIQGEDITSFGSGSDKITVQAQPIEHPDHPCAACCNAGMPDTLNASFMYYKGPPATCLGELLITAEGVWHDFTITRVGVFNTGPNGNKVPEYAQWFGVVEFGCNVEPGVRIIVGELTYVCGCAQTELGCHCPCVPENHDPGATAGCGGVGGKIYDKVPGPVTGCLGATYSSGVFNTICGTLYNPNTTAEIGPVDSTCGDDGIYSEVLLSAVPGLPLCHRFHVIVYE